MAKRDKVEEPIAVNPLHQILKTLAEKIHAAEAEKKKTSNESSQR